MKIEQNYVKSGLGSLLRSAKSKFPVLLALTAILVTATFLRADSDRNQPEHNNRLAGTWMGTGAPGVAPGLLTFLDDGRVIWSRPVTVLTGPGTFALVSTGHGEWIRTGNNEFACTVFFLAGNTSTEFNVLIKVTETIKLNHNSDEFTQTGTTSGFDPNGNLLFSFPGPVTSGKRIVAGQ